MSNKVERYWETKSGLKAVCVIMSSGSRKTHRCGYVGVPKGHPLYGVGYSDQCDAITKDMVDNVTLGKRGCITLLTACVGADDDNAIRRSPDILLDVHGGITYSGGPGEYPITSDLWWFGFDCHHSGDGEIEPDARFSFDGIVRSLEYVSQECESLADQLCRLTETKEKG